MLQLGVRVSKEWIKPVRLTLNTIIWIGIVLCAHLVTLFFRDILTAIVSTSCLTVLGIAAQKFPSLSGRTAVFKSIAAGLISSIIINSVIQINFGPGILWGDPLSLLFLSPVYVGSFIAWSFLFLPVSGIQDRSQIKFDDHFLKSLEVEDRGCLITILTHDITHISSEGDYIKIFTSGRSYLKRHRLHRVVKQLDPAHFSQIHRSTIVNKKYIKKLDPYINSEHFVILVDGTRLKQSRTFKSALLDLQTE